ncbi:MAG: translation elongation factor Ts [Deltaproteobacteria bacterium]|nr:translation elongation factor Ts [bacterium]MCB9475510.1 translation elongation factor Ts [Deltaproteobacteria bacterium]MCB9488487.1 translation elongation factor Ts [Deltaproteobacteria bacterium]
MSVTAEKVKELRERTGVGMMDCKKALTETNGDFDAAVDYLRKRGLAKAAKRAEREAAEGIVASYIHTGAKIGVMVEINCETDFVAKSDDFMAFGRNLAMHIAAVNPRWVKSEDVPEDVLAKEKEIYMEEARQSGKPEQVLEKIAEGKLRKFYEDNCLIDQAFVKDTDVKIADMMADLVTKIGEKIEIRRFVRYQVGEEV